MVSDQNLETASWEVNKNVGCSGKSQDWQKDRLSVRFAMCFLTGCKVIRLDAQTAQCIAGPPGSRPRLDTELMEA